MQLDQITKTKRVWTKPEVKSVTPVRKTSGGASPLGGFEQIPAYLAS